MIYILAKAPGWPYVYRQLELAIVIKFDDKISIKIPQSHLNALSKECGIKGI